MTGSRGPLFAAALSTLALAATACGSSGGGANAAGSGSSCVHAHGPSARVSIVTFAFHPSCLSVAAGTKVIFTNKDSTVHTASATTPGGFNSGNLAQGQSYTHTFATAGTFDYICDIHQYMSGTIVVRK